MSDDRWSDGWLKGHGAALNAARSARMSGPETLNARFAHGGYVMAWTIEAAIRRIPPPSPPDAPDDQQPPGYRHWGMFA